MYQSPTFASKEEPVTTSAHTTCATFTFHMNLSISASFTFMLQVCPSLIFNTSTQISLLLYMLYMCVNFPGVSVSEICQHEGTSHIISTYHMCHCRAGYDGSFYSVFHFHKVSLSLYTQVSISFPGVSVSDLCQHGSTCDIICITFILPMFHFHFHFALQTSVYLSTSFTLTLQVYLSFAST